MIVATLDHLDTNDLTGKRFREAFDWIASQDLEALAPGRHDIDGDAVFANVFEFDTVPADQKHYEAHRRYYDIHFLISGQEKIGVAPVTELEPLQEFDDENDFCLYGESDHASWVSMASRTMPRGWSFAPASSASRLPRTRTSLAARWGSLHR